VPRAADVGAGALNIGFDLHVISPIAFAMLVIMALVTTFLTTPALHLLAPPDMFAGSAIDARGGSADQLRSTHATSGVC
jgi:hypothetical protein